MSDKNDILILEAGTEELRISTVRPLAGRISVLDSCSFLTQEKHDDRTALQDQNLVDAVSVAVSERNWVGREAICLISGGSVSCQYFDMPNLAGPALRQAVLLKLGQHLHFPTAKAIVDIRPLASTSAAKRNQLRVAVTAAQQDASQSAVDAMTRLGLRVGSVASSAAALSAMAAARLPVSDSMRAVLYFAERHSTLCVFRGSTPVVTCELPVGMADVTKALMRPIISGESVIQLDAAKALELRNTVGIPEADQRIEFLGIPGSGLFPLLEPTLQKITQQLTQWLTFASTTEGGAQVAHIYVTGPGAALKGFTEALNKRLKTQVDAWNWLDQAVTTGEKAKGATGEEFSTAAAAMLHRRSLPDLIPLAVRKQWRLRRFRRSTALISPIVAGVILGFTFLFNQVRSYTQSTFGAQKALSDIQTVVDSNAKWLAEAERIHQLRGMFDTFALTTPAWEGLFKELSQLFASEIRTIRYSVAPQTSATLHLRVDASVYTTPTGRDFDEVVEQTLLALERSPFFTKVQLINSTRFPADGSHIETGVMAIDLELAYLRPKSAEETKAP